MHRRCWLVWCAYPIFAAILALTAIALGGALMRFLLGIVPFEYGSNAPNASELPAT